MSKQESRPVTIYALRREGEQFPYYIGQTVSAERRRRQHGVKPSEMIELERVSLQQANAAEKDWIRKAHALGVCLRNVNLIPPVAFSPRVVLELQQAPSGKFYVRPKVMRGCVLSEWLASEGFPFDKTSAEDALRAAREAAAWISAQGFPEKAERPIQYMRMRQKSGHIPLDKIP